MEDNEAINSDDTKEREEENVCTDKKDGKLGVVAIISPALPIFRARYGLTCTGVEVQRDLLNRSC